MKKTIRLTESDLMRLVKKIIKEDKKKINEFMFDNKSKGEMDGETDMDEFINEVKETLIKGKRGHWDFFSKPTPKMDLNTLISKVREICDKYEM
jgi:hypothetical protein